MTSLNQFRKNVVPVVSFSRELPDKQPVFVPEAGSRWGKPSRLSMDTSNTNDTTDPDKGPDSVVVEDNNRIIDRIGVEVDEGEEVRDPKTGQIVVQGRDWVCYCGSYKTVEIRSRKSGSATVKQRVHITHKVYVDAKPWAKYLSNYGIYAEDNTQALCDPCPAPCHEPDEPES